MKGAADTTIAAAEWRFTLGAMPSIHGSTFRVWAPEAARVDVVIHEAGAHRAFVLERTEAGYFVWTLHQRTPYSSS
jgi:1,4-alpha-glucan branching enzyme